MTSGAQEDQELVKAQQDSPQAGSTCSTCGIAAPKYCCPRCQSRSCSLPCVLAHKQATGCTGKRDRTAFLGRAQLDEKSLMSDFRFLEEVQLADEVAKRVAPPAPKPFLPGQLQTLLRQAEQRGVRLRFLPQGMAARKANTSRYDWKQGMLSWRVEWRFPAVPGNKAVNARARETSVVGVLLKEHLTPPRTGSRKGQEGLDVYREVDADTLHVLLKKHGCPANAPLYYPIGMELTLREALQGKEILEFPTLVVVLPGELEGYSLAPPDPFHAPHAPETPPAPP